VYYNRPRADWPVHRCWFFPVIRKWLPRSLPVINSAIVCLPGKSDNTGRNTGIILNELEELRVLVSNFVKERDWEQFHSPKNLSMALIVEAAELVEHFQWLTQSESHQLPEDRLAAVEEELADILVYLVRIADQLGIDLNRAARRKMISNGAKYPADKVRGSSRKYTEY
jgi:NTP pyrophosphatase (non-canonical NTP hydrolase)